MTPRKKRSGPSIGQMIDGIWGRLPHYHYLFKISPLKQPSPHENLLVFGKAVIDFCEEQGVSYTGSLSGAEYSTWLRLVGAWTHHLRDKPITRNETASRLGIDASNLTNFLNGKRALTSNALTAFAVFFEIQSFDLKPDLGANFARAAELNAARKLNAVAGKLEDVKIEIESLGSQGFPTEALLGKLEDIRGLIVQY